MDNLEVIGMALAGIIGYALGAATIYIGNLIIDYQIDKREEEETR